MQATRIMDTEERKTETLGEKLRHHEEQQKPTDFEFSLNAIFERETPKNINNNNIEIWR